MIMKSNFILLFLVLSGAFCSSLLAQMSVDDARDRFTFGVKAGLNFSNVWDERGQEFRADARAGFAGGVYLGLPIGKFLGIQPEVLISQKGFKGSGLLLDQPYSFNRLNTYLDVPLFLQVKPIPYITIVAGPQYSYLLHRKDVYTYGNNSSAQEQAFSNDNIRKNIFGLSAGLDITVKHFVASARAGWDVLNNHGDGSNDTPRYKNQWIQFTVGFKV
jgi:hypothetical protein